MKKEEYITFGEPYNINIQLRPSAFNGEVVIRKYKITVEEVKEPVKVLQERLEKLWINCNNHHLYTPLREEAKKLNYKFKRDVGSAVKL